MKKLIRFDLRRLLQGKAGIAVLIFAPAALLFCFAAVVAPYFFGAHKTVGVALLCEDGDPLTAAIVQSLVETEKSRNALRLENVGTLEEGLRLLQENEAACLVRIPEGFQQTLMSGGKQTITLYENAAQPIESSVVRDVLAAGVSLVNEAQCGVNALYAALRGRVPEAQAREAYAQAARRFLADALNKSAVFTTISVSPLGALQPVEYYAASLLVLFLSLSAIGLYAMTSADRENGIACRYAAAGMPAARAAFSRIASGVLFVFLQGLPLVILYAPLCIVSYTYGGSFPMMPLSLLLLGFLVSSLAFLLGHALPWGSTRAVFLVLALLLAAGGAVVPVSFFGPLSGIFAYSPLSCALKAAFNAFFFYDGGEFLLYSALSVVYAGLFCAAGAWLAARRER